MFLTFNSCSSLTSIPLFDTSKVTNMGSTFRDCQNVESGALALYQQASSQSNPPSNHSQTFTNCGTNTQTGAEELAQIPSDWK
jgi:surface protein